MEHRCIPRIDANLEVLILKLGMPVGVGRITNGNRWGLFVESEFRHLESEHQITLELTQSRTERFANKPLKIDALVVHKNREGFGVELDISSQEMGDLLIAMLRNSKSNLANETQRTLERQPAFAMAANS